MSQPLPSLDAIPLPGEARSDSQNEKKKPKLRHLQDTNQPSSIIVTKVVTTKLSSKDPASKLKAIVEKKKKIPPVPSCSFVTPKSPTNVSNNSGTSHINAMHSKTLPVPASQSIVDELFKDFLAAKQKEEQNSLVKRKDPDIANSMEEMSKLLDEEINLINANHPKVHMEKRGRWDSDVPINGEERSEKKARRDMEERQGSLERFVNEIASGDSVDSTEKGKGSVKLGIKLEISKGSLEWITSGELMDQKKKVVLEEGEVLSSSTDENSEESDETDKEEDLVETGSLSNSDKEKTKSKKKKKHKHKHKKKKKHKSGRGERKSKDKGSKDDKESKKDSKKEKSEEGKKRERDDKKEKRKEEKEYKSKNAEKRRHSRSRSKSPKRKKTHSRSRSRESSRYSERDARIYRRSRSRSRSRSQERHQHRGDRYRDHDERQRELRLRDRDRGGDRERSKDPDKQSGRLKETERDLRVKIDKSKLRKIAIANVLAAVKAGEQGDDVDLATLKAGGKSVEELTDFCKKISEKERDYSDSESDSDYGRHSDVDDLEGPFINHPFKLRDPSTLPNIIMNIRNSKQLPVLTPQAKATQSAQLRLQFPVSSGSQHRIKENEWVPVEKTTTPPTVATVAVVPTAAVSLATTPPVVTASVAVPSSSSTATTMVAAVTAETATTTTVVPPVPPEDKVFPDPPSMPIDIGAIVSERLSLVRKLTENPYDVQALCSLHKSQEKSSQWAASKFLPGHFTGSTGVQTLSQQELAGPDKRNQAWFKKVETCCRVLTSKSRNLG